MKTKSGGYFLKMKMTSPSNGNTWKWLLIFGTNDDDLVDELINIEYIYVASSYSVDKRSKTGSFQYFIDFFTTLTIRR